jgi:hypothetical protein
MSRTINVGGIFCNFLNSDSSIPQLIFQIHQSDGKKSKSYPASRMPGVKLMMRSALEDRSLRPYRWKASGITTGKSKTAAYVGCVVTEKHESSVPVEIYPEFPEE